MYIHWIVVEDASTLSALTATDAAMNQSRLMSPGASATVSRAGARYTGITVPDVTKTSSAVEAPVLRR